MVSARCSDCIWPKAAEFRCAGDQSVTDQIGHCGPDGLHNRTNYNLRGPCCCILDVVAAILEICPFRIVPSNRLVPYASAVTVPFFVCLRLTPHAVENNAICV